MKKIIRHLLFIYNKIYFKTQLVLFNKIIKSKNAWLIFDKSNVSGFGTNLLRTYFPIYNSKTGISSFSTAVTKKMETFIKCNDGHIFETDILKEIPQLLDLSKDETNATLPYLDNYFFGVFDASILSAMMQNFKPKQLIEIGSGISTRYINFFKQKYNLKTNVICIDPFPRVDIKEVANSIFNMPLEEALEENMFQLSKGDFLFMDGSHYVFQGNDTMAFFFKLLPSLPSGVVIHIHDIYLPYDYEENVSPQLWTEQYILAAMILNDLKDFKILYPAYYEACNNQKIKNELKNVDEILGNRNFQKRTSHDKGFSFWMKKK
ncbi:hypothetical protein ABIB40_003597 [Pedobacter sp. UYP30]|uniref:class I SAM-dependent methyltransferase n=1 Tax=Pedobacter sp. UYP30 TaxID=1756400 RepID=UPI0033956872